MKKVGVIGAGAWGTALAIACNRAACDVKLWARDESQAELIRDKNQNERYLPGIFIDPAIEITSSLKEVCDAELVIIASPAQYLRSTCINISNAVEPGVPMLISSKGVEQGSLMLMSEIAKAILPANPVAIISGPNFAHEVAVGKPSATSIASVDRRLGEQIAFSIGSSLFRPYYSDDIVGTQIGGAVKNVIAIACGIAGGREMGENTRSAIITRGLAEISRLNERLGGRTETLMGLSGMGDLVLTCTSPRSRNYDFGRSLGRGETVSNLMASGITVEGVASANSVFNLARRHRVEMPITEAVNDIISGNISVDLAVERLMSRPLKKEI